MVSKSWTNLKDSMGVTLPVSASPAVLFRGKDHKKGVISPCVKWQINLNENKSTWVEKSNNQLNYAKLKMMYCGYNTKQGIQSQGLQQEREGEGTQSWGYNRTSIVPSKPNTQAQRDTLSLAMVTVAAMRWMNMAMMGPRVLHIDSDMAIAIGMMGKGISILEIWVPSHLHHSNSIGMSWFFNVFLIFIVAIDQEIWTVLPQPTIVWVPEPTTRPSKIAIAHCISHFICCNIARYLQQKESCQNQHLTFNI